MISQLLYPVMLEDCNKWSDEIAYSVESKYIPSTDEFIVRRNAALSRWTRPMRVVPGSINVSRPIDGIREVHYRASNIYYIVYMMELALISGIGGGRIWHERYRMTAVEEAMVAAEEMDADFAAGIDKPWNRPIAWFKDGHNVVIVRSDIAENWMKQHSGNYYYDKTRQLCKDGQPVSEIISS